MRDAERRVDFALHDAVHEGREIFLHMGLTGLDRESLADDGTHRYRNDVDEDAGQGDCALRAASEDRLLQRIGPFGAREVGLERLDHAITPLSLHPDAFDHGVRSLTLFRRAVLVG